MAGSVHERQEVVDVALTSDQRALVIRLRLLKIGAQFTRSVRRIRFAIASACPYADVFALAHTRLCR
jgi:hypothetical protein